VGSLNVSSKLTYPKAAPVAGGTAFVDFGPVALVAAGHANVANPWGTVLDQDFVGNGSQTIEFSHTDSRNTMRSFAFEGALRVRVEKGVATPYGIWALAGFRYESSTYDIFGVDGWQLDQRANQVHVSLPDDLHVGHYETRYALPFLGARFEGEVSPGISLASEARFLVSWSTHEDDHAFRQKRGRAAPHGLGASISVEPAIVLSSIFRAVAHLSLQYLGSIDGKLSQAYYGDDPSTPTDETGVKIPDSSFSFSNLRLQLFAGLEARF
jgi:hypothetical protein